jgi:hypothetical protein
MFCGIFGTAIDLHGESLKLSFTQDVVAAPHAATISSGRKNGKFLLLLRPLFCFFEGLPGLEPTLFSELVYTLGGSVSLFLHKGS